MDAVWLEYLPNMLRNYLMVTAGEQAAIGNTRYGLLLHKSSITSFRIIRRAHDR